MEFLLALLYPGALGAIVTGLFIFLRSQEGRRSLKAAKTILTPIEDIETGYEAVASSMKALRKAKQEEHQLLLKNWQNSYLALLPDTDPEKTTHQAQLQGVKIETAASVLDKDGMRAKHNSLTVSNRYELIPVEDGPEWTPLPYARSKKDPDEELTYTQRRIQYAGALVRSEPSTTASTYGTTTGGAVLRFDGYVHGEPVSGNDIWFVYIGKGSGLPKFVHSLSTTNRYTSGLPYMNSLSASFARQSKYTIEPAVEIPASTVKVMW